MGLPAKPRLRWRRTTQADLEFVIATESSAENSSFVLSWTHERHLAALAEPGFAHWIFETTDIDARAIGFAILAGLGAPDGCIELKRLVVREKGVGFGRAALRIIQSEAFRRLDATQVWLDVFADNIRARALYASEGFAEDGVPGWVEWSGARRSLLIMRISRQEFENASQSA